MINLFVPQARNQWHTDRLHLTRILKHFSLVAVDSKVSTSCFRYFSNHCSFGIVENFEHHRIGFQGCSLQLSRIAFSKGSKASNVIHRNRDKFRELLRDWSRSRGIAKYDGKMRPSSCEKFALLRIKKKQERVWIGERERNFEWRNEDESMANAARRVVSTRVPNSKMYLKTHAKLHYTVETYSTIVNCKEDNVDTHVT